MIDALFDEYGEEAELENTRLDFVAMTRAKEELFVVSDDAETYTNECCEAVSDVTVKDDFRLVEDDDGQEWLYEAISSYIENLSKVSYSELDTRPKYFFEQRILNLSSSSSRMDLGSKVHDAIEGLLEGDTLGVDGLVAEHVDNARTIIDNIREAYPDVYGLELHVEAPLDAVIGEDTGLGFHGYIDAVFTLGRYGVHNSS